MFRSLIMSNLEIFFSITNKRFLNFFSFPMLEPMSKTIDQDFCPACGTILPLADGSSILQCLLCKKTQDVRSSKFVFVIFFEETSLFSISVFHGAQSSVRINFQGRSDEEVSGGNDDGATVRFVFVLFSEPN